MHQCPACGFLGLDDPPRSTATGGASDEICISCGFQFGYSDDSEGYSYATWRADWIERGMPWASVAQAAPENWDPKIVLCNFLLIHEALFCRVCGYQYAEPIWGSDDRTPDFQFCPCCGAQFGYHDATVSAVKRFREKWIADGAKWDDTRLKPENWSLEAQLQDIPAKYKT